MFQNYHKKVTADREKDKETNEKTHTRNDQTKLKR